jgi:hypothetical protein
MNTWAQNYFHFILPLNQTVCSQRLSIGPRTQGSRHSSQHLSVHLKILERLVLVWSPERDEGLRAGEISPGLAHHQPRKGATYYHIRQLSHTIPASL